MNNNVDDIANVNLVLESLTHTLLYEGYALYPYNRSAVKNQKPIPFGVVFPTAYNEHNEHAHAHMQTQCIITGSDELSVDVTVRFLHLKRIELCACPPTRENFIPVGNINIGGKFYEAGWQTIERKIEARCL